MNKTEMTLFGKDFLARMARCPPESWARELTAPDSRGHVYLNTLRKWFKDFPFASNKQRDAMKIRVESFVNSDHLGAVNELSWYGFMRHLGLQAQPIPAGKASRPDFKVTAPTEFFVEVSTLNTSDSEKTDLRITGSVELKQEETLRRLLQKASGEKEAQAEYAASIHRPCLLVLFDYTFWSQFATDLYIEFADVLLGEERAFGRIPNSFSAIVYVERRFIFGRMGLSRLRSALYYNPAPRYHLPFGIFDKFQQFGANVNSNISNMPSLEDSWIWL